MTFNLNNQNYNIETELRARKILEKNTDYCIVFDKNQDKYGYDIQMWNYVLYENNHNKKFLGYIEIEHCKSWGQYDIPSNWYEISFLERKVMGQFNIGKTFYLKFNNHFTNCFCVNILDLVNHGEYSKRNCENSLIKNKRYDRYIVLPKNSPYVVFGVLQSINHIQNYFKEELL